MTTRAKSPPAPAGWTRLALADGRAVYAHPSGWRVRYYPGFPYPYIPTGPAGRALTDAKDHYFKTLLGAVRAIARQRRKSGRRYA